MQAQLEGMKKDVKTIQKVVYQQNNLTPAGSSGVVKSAKETGTIVGMVKGNRE